jgi:hypothetical protein
MTGKRATIDLDVIVFTETNRKRNPPPACLSLGNVHFDDLESVIECSPIKHDLFSAFNGSVITSDSIAIFSSGNFEAINTPLQNKADLHKIHNERGLATTITILRTRLKTLIGRSENGDQTTLRRKACKS